MTLENLGWNSHWEQVLRSVAAELRLSGEWIICGRVVACHRGRLDVETETGTLRVAGCEATVGDWVLLEPNAPRLLSVLSRRTQISRRAPGGRTEEQVLAANVDVAILVMGLDSDFNLRRLERFLVVVKESGAKALVLLNKADLCDELSRLLQQTCAVSRDTPVIAVSALVDDLAVALKPHLAGGESAALLGSSGAGKSTILNALLGESRQETGPVRERDSRGRHTTTLRQLVVCPQGWLMFDLPGLREVRLWAGKESLVSAFDEIEDLARHCRFRDCTHRGEPGCAVVPHVSADRLASFQRLARELDSLEARQGSLASQNTKRRWKQIHKAMRRDAKSMRFQE